MGDLSLIHISLAEENADINDLFISFTSDGEKNYITTSGEILNNFYFSLINSIYSVYIYGIYYFESEIDVYKRQGLGCFPFDNETYLPLSDSWKTIIWHS